MSPEQNVNDCLVRLPTLQAAKVFAVQISTLLANAGFHLRRWRCSRREVLELLPESESGRYKLEIDNSRKTLGVVMWNALEDNSQFTFSTQVRPRMRRWFLSMLSTIFEPVGLVSSLILPGCWDSYGRKG